MPVQWFLESCNLIVLNDHQLSPAEEMVEGILAILQGLKPNANKLKKLFTNHCKPQFRWMKELSSRVYQYVFINLGKVTISQEAGDWFISFHVERKPEATEKQELIVGVD